MSGHAPDCSVGWQVQDGLARIVHAVLAWDRVPTAGVCPWRDSRYRATASKWEVSSPRRGSHLESIRIIVPDFDPAAAATLAGGKALLSAVPWQPAPHVAWTDATWSTGAQPALAPLATPADGLRESDRRFLQRFNRAIDLLHADPELRLAALCERLALSERALQRKLRQLLGCRPAEYLRAYRLDRARPLLAAGLQVSQVVERVGFAGHAYFSRCFKAAFGVSPSAFRDAQLAAQRQSRSWRAFAHPLHLA